MNKQPQLRFLSNTYDPKQPDASYTCPRMSDQTQQQAWESHARWLADKIIGDPQATEWYTVDQLKSMHMVGVYAA
jgi:hypothetical protein